MSVGISTATRGLIVSERNALFKLEPQWYSVLKVFTLILSNNVHILSTTNIKSFFGGIGSDVQIILLPPVIGAISSYCDY